MMAPQVPIMSAFNYLMLANKTADIWRFIIIIICNSGIVTSLLKGNWKQLLQQCLCLSDSCFLTSDHHGKRCY